MKDINILRDKAYKIACDKGFHDKELSDEHWLMLVITELAEAVEADRKGKRAGMLAFVGQLQWFKEHYTNLGPGVEDKCFCGWFDEYIKDTVEDEFADTVIRLLDLAGLRDIELHNVPFIDLCAENLINFCYGACECLTFKGIDLSTKINATINNIIWWCDRNDINLEWHVKQKMKYNELRPRLHGKRY